MRARNLDSCEGLMVATMRASDLTIVQAKTGDCALHKAASNLTRMELSKSIARALKQIDLLLKQGLYVLPDKYARALKQGCTCPETNLHVFPDKYTRGSRIISRTYDSRTLRTKRTKERSVRTFDLNWNLNNYG